MEPPEHSEKPWIFRFGAVPFWHAHTARQNFERISLKLSPALVLALPALLADLPDPDSGLLLLERLVNEVSLETLRLVENNPFLAHYAVAVFGNSWFLGETLIRNPDLLQTFLREKHLDRSFS